MALDRLDNQNSPNPDGIFDFIPDQTIVVKNGRIYFPVLEPFGSYLRKQFAPNESVVADKYVFQELYDSTKTQAQQIPTKNRFKIKGSYKSSSSSEISLNSVNIPQGSVTVTANGTPLTENVDYTVDYISGKVKIINDALLISQTPIKATFETNQLFQIQSKSLFGTHLEYKVNKDFVLGGTLLHLTERPITQKINIGEEPISNTIFGFDGTYRTEAPFLTKLVDHIPLINTKEKSTITASAEYAQLVPGHSKAIGKSGTSYIDDFEGSQSALDFKTVSAWILASTPQGQSSGLFKEGEITDNILNGINRAKLSWYVIDPLFYRDSQFTPGHIKSDKAQRSNHFVREVLETEIFPNKQPINNQVTNLPVLDLSFTPAERGPYNYDVKPTSFSKGLNADGTLKQPETRWGGIMRKIETNDFEASNIEFIQFWMMDPFNDDNANPNTTGDLIFNLGDISEDIIRDGQKSFENGLPTSATPNPQLISSTHLAIVPSPSNPSVVNAFDNEPSSRVFQDIGLDGLNDVDERTFFSAYLNDISATFGAGSIAYTNANNDASADDYQYFRGANYDANQTSILDRYKSYNGLEGNSTLATLDGGPTSSTSLPNIEDVNKDNNLLQFENYYQYRVKLDPTSMIVGQNHITDERTATVQTKDGRSRQIKWYQFKVPVKTPELIVGEPDIRNIRSVRMILKGFDKPIICRFARLEFLRGDWRKYDLGKLSGEYEPVDNGNGTFNISAVNVEENSNRVPINYVVPPGIERERDITTTNNRQLNEQSLSFNVCNLEDGNSKAAYKNVDIDMRQYKKLKLYLHEEPGNATDALNFSDLHFFIRLGTDFNDNYYEYDLPMKPTPWGTSNADEIWPQENDMEIVFSSLQNAKKARNAAINVQQEGVALQKIFETMDGDRRVSIKGNPNLSAVKIIMIGVRNPKRFTLADADDGLTKCAQVWVNELRLTDFNESGGWAANARVTAKMADFASVTLAASRMTEGFGGIEQKLNERSRQNTFQYDASAEVKLDKFIPEKVGMSIPMYVGYSEAFINPQYNPLDPDIKFKESLETYPKGEARDNAKHQTQDYTKRRSLNFANVKKERGRGKTGKPAG